MCLKRLRLRLGGLLKLGKDVDIELVMEQYVDVVSMVHSKFKAG